jgi:hypothetical protein
MVCPKCGSHRVTAESPFLKCFMCAKMWMPPDDIEIRRRYNLPIRIKCDICSAKTHSALKYPGLCGSCGDKWENWARRGEGKHYVPPPFLFNEGRWESNTEHAEIVEMHTTRKILKIKIVGIMRRWNKHKIEMPPDGRRMLNQLSLEL